MFYFWRLISDNYTVSFLFRGKRIQLAKRLMKTVMNRVRRDLVLRLLGILILGWFEFGLWMKVSFSTSTSVCECGEPIGMKCIVPGCQCQV